MIKIFLKMIKSIKTMSLNSVVKPGSPMDEKMNHEGLIASLLSKHPSFSALKKAERMNRKMKKEENRMTNEQLFQTTSRPEWYRVKNGKLTLKRLTLDMLIVEEA